MDSLSIKELKRLIAEAGIPLPQGAVEKTDLVQLAIRASQTKRRAYSRVNAIGVPLERADRCVIVLFHGYGADENQFKFLLDVLPSKTGIAMICPKSAADGWWPLNPAELGEWAAAMQSGKILDKMKQEPLGLKAARDNALEFVKELKAKAPKSAKFILGGFSQGAAMAIDLALSAAFTEEFKESPVHIMSFSSYLVDMTRWEEKAAVLKDKIHILVAHGRSDFLIPFAASQIVYDLFTLAGAKVTYKPHVGAHVFGDESTIKAYIDFVEYCS